MGSIYSPPITNADIGKNIVIYTNQKINGTIMSISNDGIITININGVDKQYTNRNITIGDLPKLYHYSLSGPTGLGKRKSRRHNRRHSKRSKRTHKKTRRYIRRR